MPPDELRAVARRLTLAREAVPTLCGASLHGLGVEPLLDAMTAYLPAPDDRALPALRASLPTGCKTDGQESSEVAMDDEDRTAGAVEVQVDLWHRRVICRTPLKSVLSLFARACAAVLAPCRSRL